MSEKNFKFSSENIKDASSFRNNAVKFINHSNFKLEDGDEMIVYSNYVAIKRHDTGKIGLYRADNGLQILVDVFDTIEIRHSDESKKKYAEHNSKTTFFEVSYNGCYGAYSEYGLQIVPVKYKKGIVFFDNMFIVTSRENSNMGVYDDKGRLIIQIENTQISIRYGIIIVSKKTRDGTKEYAFNRYGQSLIKDYFYEDIIKGYDKISVYKNCIITRENGLEEIFDKDGRRIIAKGMRDINVFEKYIIAQDECGKYGVYDFGRRTLVPHEYDRVTKFGMNYIKCKYGKSECLFYVDGRVVIRRGVYQRITETKYGAVAISFDGEEHKLELRMYKVTEL